MTLTIRKGKNVKTYELEKWKNKTLGSEKSFKATPHWSEKKNHLKWPPLGDEKKSLEMTRHSWRKK